MDDATKAANLESAAMMGRLAAQRDVHSAIHAKQMRLAALQLALDASKAWGIADDTAVLNAAREFIAFIEGE